jgi:hypothetical protein
MTKKWISAVTLMFSVVVIASAGCGQLSVEDLEKEIEKWEGRAPSDSDPNPDGFDDIFLPEDPEDEDDHERDDEDERDDEREYEGSPFSFTWDFSNQDDYDVHSSNWRWEERGAALEIQKYSLIQDTDSRDFSKGSAWQTTFSSEKNALQLSKQGVERGEGFYLSRIFDAGTKAGWSSFYWTPFAPYGKRFPEGKTETNYLIPGASLDQALLLLSFPKTPLGRNFRFFRDRSKSGSHATFIGQRPSRKEGIWGDSLSLKGRNEWVDVPSMPRKLNGLDEFTFSIWAKSDVSFTNRGLLSGASAKGRDETLGLRYNRLGDDEWGVNGIKASLRVATQKGDKVLTLESSSHQQSGEWQLLTLTWRSGESLELYINGKKDVARFQSEPLEGVVTGVERFLLGKGLADRGKKGWKGEIDEVAFWSKKLTEDEVQALYWRGSKKIALQVRSCQDVTCSGVPFVGPYGRRDLFYSELLNPTEDMPRLNLSGLERGRYFQYRIHLKTKEVKETPYVGSIGVEFETGAQKWVLRNQFGVPFQRITSFQERFEAQGDVRTLYQISADGHIWHFWNGSAWSEARESSAQHSNSAAVIDSQIALFGPLERGEFFFKLFVTGGSEDASLLMNQIRIDGLSGDGY